MNHDHNKLRRAMITFRWQKSGSHYAETRQIFLQGESTVIQQLQNKFYETSDLARLPNSEIEFVCHHANGPINVTNGSDIYDIIRSMTVFESHLPYITLEVKIHCIPDSVKLLVDRMIKQQQAKEKSDKEWRLMKDTQIAEEQLSLRELIEKQQKEIEMLKKRVDLINVERQEETCIRIRTLQEHSAACDQCSKLIIGHRYKCTICDDYDLCQDCEIRGVHAQHAMVRIVSETHTEVPDHLKTGKKVQRQAAQQTREAEKKQADSQTDARKIISASTETNPVLLKSSSANTEPPQILAEVFRQRKTATRARPCSTARPLFHRPTRGNGRFEDYCNSSTRRGDFNYTSWVNRRQLGEVKFEHEKSLEDFKFTVELAKLQEKRFGTPVQERESFNHVKLAENLNSVIQKKEIRTPTYKAEPEPQPDEDSEEVERAIEKLRAFQKSTSGYYAVDPIIAENKRLHRERKEARKAEKQKLEIEELAARELEEKLRCTDDEIDVEGESLEDMLNKVNIQPRDFEEQQLCEENKESLISDVLKKIAEDVERRINEGDNFNVRFIQKHFDSSTSCIPNNSEDVRSESSLSLSSSFENLSAEELDVDGDAFEFASEVDGDDDDDLLNIEDSDNKND